MLLTLQPRPVEHVLQYVDGHDHARLPPAVQREDGQVGGQKVRGLLCVCRRPCTTTATAETEQNRRYSVKTELQQTLKKPIHVSVAEKGTVPGGLLDVWSNVVDLRTHLVSDHFAGGGSCICSQHHPILHQMNTQFQPLISLNVFTHSELKTLL